MPLTKNHQVVDLLGVGIGPFNLSLAALSAEIDELNCVFFDSKTQFDWHAGLLLDGCTLQVPFMADLVTMADPTHPLSYLNYLQKTQRLYGFYFYENFFIQRKDYNQYCQWVCHQLPHLHFGQQVNAIEEHKEGFLVSVMNLATAEVKKVVAKHVVLGVGSTPYIPEVAANMVQQNIIHSAEYLPNRPSFLHNNSITLIGAGQSAAEIFIDLLNNQQQYGYELNWLTRSQGFLPMEYSKLGLEHFSPDYIDHFHQLNEKTKDHILKGQGLWYKGISANTISDIYQLLYQRQIVGETNQITLQANSELVAINATNDQLKLTFQHSELNQRFSINTTALILATGYQPSNLSCLSPLQTLLKKDQHQRLLIDRQYRIMTQRPLKGHIFIQNGELHTHGIGAPDLGLGAYRSAMIINTLLNKNHFNLAAKNVFQSFGIAPKWQHAITDHKPIEASA